MKIILLLSLFCNLLLAFTSEFTKSNSTAFIDIQDEYRVETINQEKDKFLLDGDLIYKVLDKPVWTYFSIKNNLSKEQSLVVHNSLRILRKIDVLIIHKDGKKDILKIGTNRKNEYTTFGSSGYSLHLKPYEKVEIYTRHKSIGLVNTHWNVSGLESHNKKKALENSLDGGIIGIISLIVLYSFILFIITKEKSNLYFNGYIVSRIGLMLTVSGFFYSFNYELGLFARSIIFFYTPLILLFESLFLISLYDLKTRSRIFYRIFSSTYILSIIFLFLALYSTMYTPNIYIIKSILLFLTVFIIIVFIFSVYAIYKKWTGAFTLLASVCLYIYLRYSYLTNIDHNYLFTFTLMIIAIIESLLIVTTLTLNIRKIYEEKMKAKQVVLDHAKYFSIGTMHASTIHQLRTPIGHMGAIAARIRCIFEIHKDQLNKEEYESAIELEQIISMSNDTISDLYNLYNTDQERENFDIKESIEEIVLLINTKSQNNNIPIVLSLISAPVLNYPNSLKQIILIIVENAIDILSERNINQPIININLTKDETSLRILISDNAGGIEVEPIEDIFEIYKSYKKTRGLGLGLALAKNLADLANIKIDVSNTSEGALFTLIIVSL